ncbi:hypothetical protein AAHE18_11G165500 [Arachis hypogaea]
MHKRLNHLLRGVGTFTMDSHLQEISLHGGGRKLQCITEHGECENGYAEYRNVLLHCITKEECTQLPMAKVKNPESNHIRCIQRGSYPLKTLIKVLKQCDTPILVNHKSSDPYTNQITILKSFWEFWRFNIRV